MRLLTDADVSRFLRAEAVEVMRRAVRAAERGELTAPARVHAADVTFTVGGSADVFGFRVYHTRDTPFDEQVVVVWDASGRIAGVVMGSELGPLRTSALGVLATQTLARPDASRLGLIGSGVQARHHALTLASVRELTQVLVYSRQAEGRERLAAELRAAGLPAQAANSAEEVCVASDLLTLATNSGTPVIQSEWVRPGTHVCTLGPKEEHRHEFPPELARRAAQVVTDSPTQLRGYAGGHVLAGENVMSLGACLTGGVTRHPDDITLFLSVGLAGTEVLLAQAILRAGEDKHD
ncbi:ornithine cyclodeaminase family protein [Deinococcus cavernae]|uniref:Ornithine cyclodeaminase family protein n=1 Tax=Deinococcus cavernae TaxID=2320857 RepID=A0A418V7F9_9DEIO|nr:ornithine cyclodeaminase family protein [Deinococcus cavernae]RJF72038.1 ornithine cyclodeaminase family protein [Deinococcus cavernae]